MTWLRRKSLAELGLVVLSGFWLSGCAGFGAPFAPGNTAVVFLNERMSVQQAEATVTLGQSTKADVLTALGPATVLQFDSGHEVWVYRGKALRAPATSAEFVVLFAPLGTAQKTRIRSAHDGQTR